MEKLRILDIFSGIGGFSLGFETTGFFETVAFCEIDKDARKVLQKNFPSVPIFEDVKTLSVLDISEGVDIICGGFPCFPAGTFIVTNKGQVPIENIKVGDMVLSHGDEEFSNTGSSSVCGETETSSTDYVRFWPTFASEEEKSIGWSRFTFKFRDWWETFPPFRRVDDDVSVGLDCGLDTGIEPEKFRKARIKQLGNSIVPGIAQLIAERIAMHEGISKTESELEFLE